MAKKLKNIILTKKKTTVEFKDVDGWMFDLRYLVNGKETYNCQIIKATIGKLRAFAIGDLGWSLEKYRGSTLYEFNESVKGFWRAEERRLWHTREIVWEMIRGNPGYENKPTSKDQIYKLSSDEPEKIEKTPKTTEQDVKVFEAMQFNKQ